MNKVFKVIWSEARNAYVVVSEIAKNHGSKSCSTKKLLTMLIATGVMTCASMAPAMAATNVDSNANVTVKKGATVTVAENATVTVGDNAIVLGKGASAVKDSVAIGSGASVVAGNNGSSGVALGNKAHAGYKGTSLGSSVISGREGTTLVGANINSASLYTTVVGTDSVINSDGTSYTALGRSVNVQGAAATVVGSKNTVDNKNGKVYSGVANNVMGSANTIEASNGVTIQGIGNKVTDAYKDMNISIWEAYNIGKGDYSALAKKKSGAVAVVGGANTVSKQTDSTVIGYDNKLTGDKEKGSQNVFMAGSHNTLTNVSNSLVMGDNNTLEGRKNVISLGNNNTVTANKAVAIGNGTTVEAEGGVAIGESSVAKGSHSTAIGNESNVDGDNGLAIGYKSKIIKGSVHEHGTSDATVVGNQSVIGTDSNLSTIIGANSDIDGQAYCSTIIGAKSSISWGASGSTAVGEGTKVYKAWGTALGSGSKVTNENGTALGTYSSVTVDDGVAIGAISRADRAAGELGYLADTDTTDITWKANKGAVSVGSSAAKFTREITNVAAGTADTDAVNVAQLKKVNEEALKHSTVTNGDNIVVTEGLNKDGGKEYKVALKNDITLAGDNDAFVNISGSKGSVWASSSVAAGNVIMDGTTATVSGLGNTTTAYDGFANGKGKAATEEQLKEVATEAGKHTQVKAGTNVGIVPSETADGTHVYTVNADGTTVSGDSNVLVTAGEKDANNVTNYGVKLNKDLKGIESVSNGDAKLALNGAAGYAGIVNGKGASVYMQGSTTVINNKVSVDKDGKISGVAAGKISADSTDAVNGSQLNAVATEASKHSKVVNGSNTNVEETTVDGQKVYKVNLNNNIMVGDVNGKNVSISGTNGTIEATGYITTKDRVYADKGAKLADIDVTGNMISNGDAKLALNGAAGYAGIVNGKGASVYMQGSTTVINNKVSVDKDGKISGVAAGKISADSTDAVNGSQLNAVATEASKHSKVVNGSNTNVEESTVDGQKVYKVNLNNNIMVGDVAGKNVSISGTNGTIETTGYIATKDRVYADKGAKLADIDVTGNKISNGASSIVLDGSNVKVNDKVTIDQNGKISGVAAGEVSSTSTDAINGSQLHQTNENVAQNKADIAQNKADIAQNKADIATNKADIAQNKADIAQNKADIATNKADIAQNKADIAQNKTDIKNLDNRVTNVEELAKKHTTVTAGDNITVAETTNADGGKEYKVALNKDISVDSVKAGDTTITDKGLEIKDGPSVTKDGINAGNKKITGVAKGEADTDAVNYGQLKETNNHIDRVENQVVSNTNRINQLGSRVNKVGAGAAALAALHPMDFDPDDKLTFSAGYGNYGGENAAAIGAYYRPDEKVMFSVGGTVGNGENMVNAGVSFSLDRTNHVSNSRTAMAREILDLRAEVTELKAMVAKGGLGSIAEDKMKIFPDVAENHWAYEYVGKLAAAGIIEGYPDGNFSGDRMMSRYEFAAMLYRAMQKGAQLDSKIINEFAPEMGRIRVDRISGEDGDRDKIERVRVNAVKGERDHYGNKIAKAEAKAK